MICRCQTLEGAWKVIDLLRQRTAGWSPAVGFIVVLRDPDGRPEVHLDESSWLRHQDLLSIKETLKKLKETIKP